MSSEPLSYTRSFRGGDGPFPCPAPPRRSREDRLHRAMIGAMACLAIGGYGAFWVITESVPGYGSLHWPQTQGTILVMDVERYLNKGSPKIVIKTRYTYTVNGKQYYCNRFSYPDRNFDCSWNSQQEKELTAPYREGSHPPVYYNPNNPSQACLERGPNYFFTYMHGSISAFMLSIGSICVLSFFSALRQPAPPAAPVESWVEA